MKRMIPLSILILLMTATFGFASTNGPFGVGTPETGIHFHGLAFFEWMTQKQNEFYMALKTSLKLLKEDRNAGLWLITLSFAYGVFHAVGPGHGKTVITSYVLSNDETIASGITMSFTSAFLQAVMAITIVTTSFALFHLTAMTVTSITTFLEQISAVAVLSLGIWLSWKKVLAPLLGRKEKGCVCSIPESNLRKTSSTWKKTIRAVLPVGIRPCTGALIVLTFAMAQNMVFSGIVSVLAMAFGTALTVSFLTSMTLGAKFYSMKKAEKSEKFAELILNIMEGTGAIIILSTGLLLTSTSIVTAMHH